MRAALLRVRSLAAQQQSLFLTKTLEQCRSIPQFSYLGCSSGSLHQRWLGRVELGVRCSGSTVKKMDKVATKQLDEADNIGQRGEDDTDDLRKGPEADRLVEMGSAFRERAAEKMGKAVSITRESFLRQRQKGTGLCICF